MQFNLRNVSNIIAELTIKSDNTIITEDLATGKGGTIPRSTIEQFITVAREMNLFNKNTDVDFVEMVAEALLNNNELEELIERLSNLKQPI
ncbi:MAG TPA: hypothetical protein VF476_11705 [Chitinophagaceae bacterium]